MLGKASWQLIQGVTYIVRYKTLRPSFDHDCRLVQHLFPIMYPSHVKLRFQTEPFDYSHEDLC